MWIFTAVGFFSTVQHKDNPHRVMVRARLMADTKTLNAFLQRTKVCIPLDWAHTPNADYLYRASLTKHMWSRILARLAEDIEYTNFKNAVHEDGPRDQAYMRVWSEMNRLQFVSKTLPVMH